MDKETLRMQMLAGVITESEYAAAINQEVENTEKDSLNEHFVAGGIVGIGAINQIPPRAKTDYEDAFEYFLSQKYSINEAEEMSVDAAADKVENAVDDKLEATVDALTDEQKEQLRAELAKAGITANTDPEAIAGKLDESLFEAEGDAKAKIANALSDIGGGLMKSLLVPIIPVAIGSMGPGVAAGLAITAGTAGILIALAKALGAEKSMEEGKKEVKEELQNDDMIYDRMMDMDQEQLISSMLSYAEQNPSVTLTDYLNDEFGYESEDELDEGKKKYYKDAEADDAEHIKALEKDMKDDKDSSMKIKEVVFPMWQRINK